MMVGIHFVETFEENKKTLVAAGHAQKDGGGALSCVKIIGWCAEQ
jgi:hypothetical protein